MSQTSISNLWSSISRIGLVVFMGIAIFLLSQSTAHAETINANTRESLEAQISELMRQMEDTSNIQIANNTRLAMTVPAIVSVGSSYEIEWEDLSGPTLSRLASAFPSAVGEIIAQNKNQSLGVSQTVAQNIPMSKLLSGEIEWHVGTLTNDGRVMPSGTYTMALYISLPEDDEDDEGGATIAQGNSSEFLIHVPKTVTMQPKNPEVERMLVLLDQLLKLYREMLEKEQHGL